MSEIKENIESKRGKKKKQNLFTYKGSSIRLSADFQEETLQAERERHDRFKLLKRKILQPRTLYLAKLSLRIEGR